PPAALPPVPGLIYLQMNRESQPEEWLNVQKALTLAIRFNETLLEGNIQGEKEVGVRINGKTIRFQFILYVVRRAKEVVTERTTMRPGTSESSAEPSTIVPRGRPALPAGAVKR